MIKHEQWCQKIPTSNIKAGYWHDAELGLINSYVSSISYYLSARENSLQEKKNEQHKKKRSRLNTSNFHTVNQLASVVLCIRWV
jgi:NADH:ubiquinone oxidoreductase subunit 2 (subunit N)